MRCNSSCPSDVISGLLATSELSLRGCKISGFNVSLKEGSAVSICSDIDLTGVEVIKDSSNEVFNRFLLDFGSPYSSFTEKNVLLIELVLSLVFSTICFRGSMMGLKCFTTNPYFCCQHLRHNSLKS